MAITFPEGTKILMLQYNQYDTVDDDYPISSLRGFTTSNNSGGYGILPPKNFTKVKQIEDGLEHAISDLYLPKLGMTYTGYNTFGSDQTQYIMVFETIPSAQTSQAILNKPRYAAYVNYEEKNKKVYLVTYLPDTPLVYYGDISINVRVLKNGEWLNGQPLNFNHQPMEYKGGGLYNIMFHQEPRERFNYVIDDGEFGKSVDLISDEFTVLFGDNSALQTIITGETINDVVTSNPNGWYYNAIFGGFTNNDINDNQTTSMTIALPANVEVDFIVGQSSEEKYDFCTIYDSKGNTLLSLKGINGDDKLCTLKTTDGIYKFTYKKDSSNSNGRDAFWIKSISYNFLPPYPEN